MVTQVKFKVHEHVSILYEENFNTVITIHHPPHSSILTLIYSTDTCLDGDMLVNSLHNTGVATLRLFYMQSSFYNLQWDFYHPIATIFIHLQ